MIFDSQEAAKIISYVYPPLDLPQCIILVHNPEEKN